METTRYFEVIGMWAAVLMPLWNIPLMVRIHRRKTSADISLAWLFGVWGCIVLMFPSTLTTSDRVLRAFGVSNLVLFSLVVVVVMIYRRPAPQIPPAP